MFCKKKYCFVYLTYNTTHVGTKERNSGEKNEELIGKSIADFTKILANYKKR